MAKPTTAKKSTAKKSTSNPPAGGTVAVGRSSAAAQQQTAPPPERTQTQPATPPETAPPPATSQPLPVHVPQGSQPLAERKVDLAADAAEFQDHFDRRSIQLPFLAIVQPGSPQVKKGQPGFVEGVEMSQFFNTMTKESFDGLEQGLEVIPCYHYATYIEWRLRELGGGFINDHGLDKGTLLAAKTRRDEKNRDILPGDKTHLVLTETYFLLLVMEDEDGKTITERVMFPLTSTNLKHARNWNSRIMSRRVEIPGKGSVNAPMFFNTWVIKTAPDKNEKGEWYKLVVEDGQPTLNLGDEVYLSARDFRLMAQTGIQAGTIAQEPAGSDAGGSPTGTDESIPF
jgi:hypothetical protein